MTPAPVGTPAPANRAALHPALLAIAALFAFIVLVQGISAPFQKDAEPQSAEWIQSIVRDGHWLIPYDAYGYPDRKPPLFYWLSALVAKATGGTVDEVRARAVSVVAGTALAVGVLAWTVANVGTIEGWLAFLFMLGTYGFASRATEALTDMLLTFLLFAAYSAIYPLLDAPTAASPDFTRRKIFVGVILGLGILAKGPIAIVLCALAASIYLLIERRNPIALLRQRWPWQVVAIAVAIGAIWYVPAALVGGHKIVRIIFAENFGHFMPAKLGGTGRVIAPSISSPRDCSAAPFPMTLLIVPAALAFYTGEISPEKRRPVIYQISMSLAVLLFLLDRKRQARRLHPAGATGDRDSVRVGVYAGCSRLGGEVARRTRCRMRLRPDHRHSVRLVFPRPCAKCETSVERLRLLRALQVHALGESRLGFVRRLVGRRHYRSICYEPALAT